MTLAIRTLRVCASSTRPTAKSTAVTDKKKPVVTAGKTFSDISAAVDAGLVKGCAPFEDGLDAFGFFDNIDQAEAQRYADVEITHGRVAMLAAVGVLVGEQVEGSSFLFDSQVTGPAINHFQQVPGLFWGLLGAFIFVVEASRVQQAWQDPFVADRLFLLKSDHVPGDYGFDPLGLGDGISDEELARHKMGELNNGRLAMIAISGMVGQELVNGLNLLPADDVMGLGFRLPARRRGSGRWNRRAGTRPTRRSAPRLSTRPSGGRCRAGEPAQPG